MQIVADRMRPDPELLALVQGIAELVRPDNVELAQWYGNYARQHAARIAHDVALVERYSTAQERVVDVAAVPLLLSAASRHEAETWRESTSRLPDSRKPLRHWESKWLPAT